MKIRTKILIAIIIPGVLIPLIISTAIFYSVRELTLQKTYDHLETVATLKQEQVETLLTGYSQTIEALLEEYDPVTYSLVTQYSDEYSRAALEKDFFAFKNTHSEILSLSFTNEEGVVLISTVKAYEGTNQLEELNWDNDAIESRFEIIEVQTGSFQLVYIQPVIHDNMVVGYIIKRISVDELYSLMEDPIAQGSTGEMFLVDGNYKLLSPSDTATEKILVQEYETKSLQQCFSNKDSLETERVSYFNEYRNTTVVSVPKYLEEYDWCLVLEVDETEIVGQQQSQLAVTIFTITTIVVTILIPASILISRSFSTPIEKLKEGIKMIEGGKLDYKLSLDRNDEIGELSKMFERMTRKLNSSQVGLQENISEKTSELEKTLQEYQDQNKNLNETKKAMLNLLEDIDDERKASQVVAQDLKKFKQAVENASDHIIITDKDGFILYANSAAERITGYSFQEMTGNTPSLWGKQMPKEFYKKMWDKIKVKKDPFKGEIRNKRKNGVVYEAEVNISPILNNEGEVSYFVGIERDITRAKEISRMKSEFLSVAAHQLRTPLGSMRWNLEMLIHGDMGKLSQSIMKTVGNIYDSNLRLIDLINDLLNVSRLEQGRVKNEPKKTNIVEVIQSIIKELTFATRKKHVSVSLDVKDKNLPEIVIDPQLFREVIQNLVSNAIKYNVQDGKVFVTLEKIDDTVKIVVEDTGMGIPKHAQHRMFDKFFRAENAVKSETEGSGLGLFVVKSYVEAWGGKVTFTSTEGKGTIFTIILPIKPKQKFEKPKDE